VIRLPRAGRQHRLFTAVLAVVGAMVILVGVVGTMVASAAQSPVGLGTATPSAVLAAATAPAVSQCNPPAFPTGAGYEVTCTAG